MLKLSTFLKFSNSQRFEVGVPVKMFCLSGRKYISEEQKAIIWEDLCAFMRCSGGKSS